MILSYFKDFKNVFLYFNDFKRNRYHCVEGNRTQNWKSLLFRTHNVTLYHFDLPLSTLNYGSFFPFIRWHYLNLLAIPSRRENLYSFKNLRCLHIAFFFYFFKNECKYYTNFFFFFVI